MHGARSAGAASDDPLIAALQEAHARSKMVGWDFSRLEGRMLADEPWWDFEEDCRAAMSRARSILDLGTGGGERLLRLLDRSGVDGGRVVATEGWEPNVGLARQALRPRGVELVRYDAERGERMPFPDASFELVMSRHEAFEASELARVLAPGGVLLTQQVDGRDAEEIHEWFDAPFLYPQANSARCVADLASAGLRIEAVDEWRGTMEFADVEALVVYLAMVPWDAPGFTVDAHAQRLIELAQRSPIRVTQRRFRVHAVKPREPRDR